MGSTHNSPLTLSIRGSLLCVSVPPWFNCPRGMNVFAAYFANWVFL